MSVESWAIDASIGTVVDAHDNSLAELTNEGLDKTELIKPAAALGGMRTMCRQKRRNT